MLDVVLERDETGDAEIIAMLDRSNRLAIAILELLDDAGGPSSEELENLRKMIYNGMRC